jgi:hypothetical protein
MKDTNKLGVNLDDIVRLVKLGKSDCCYGSTGCPCNKCKKKRHKKKPSQPETVSTTKPTTGSNSVARISGLSNSGSSNNGTLNSIGNTIQNDTARINNDMARFELQNWKNNQMVQSTQPQNRFGSETLMMPQLKKPKQFNNNYFRPMGDKTFEAVENIDNSSISPLTAFTNEVYENDTVMLDDNNNYEDDPYNNDLKEEYAHQYDYNNRQHGGAIVELSNNKNSPMVSYKKVELGNIYPNNEISNPNNDISNPQNKEDEEMIEMVANPLINKRKFIRNDEPNPLVTDDMRGLVQKSAEKKIAGQLTSNKPNRITNLRRDFMLQRLREYNDGADKYSKVKTGNLKIYEVEEAYIKVFGMPKQIKL